MSLHRIRARGDTKCQNLNSFLYLTSIFFFSELKGYLAKPFSKRLTVFLVFTFIILGDVLGKQSPRFNPASFSEAYTQAIALVNSHVIVLYVHYAIYHISWILYGQDFLIS